MQRITHEPTDAQRDILYYVGAWYNGCRIRDRDDGEWLMMATCHPPSLQELIGADDTEWRMQYEYAAEELRDEGFLKTEYICRRKVDWVPTKEGRQWIDEEFAGDFGEYSRWLSDDSDVGLLGDWNEGLYHRTGVDTVAYKMAKLPWVEQVVVYPGEHGQRRPDAEVTTTDGDTWDVEVLTYHHDRPDYQRKYEFLAERDRPALWVFDTRRLCFLVLGWIQGPTVEPGARLIKRSFNNPENWSIAKGNEYIYRTHNEPGYECPGIAMIQTITRWLEADIDTIEGWFEEYFTQH